MARKVIPVTEPLKPSDYGFCFPFSYDESRFDGFMKDGAFCLFDVLGEKQFSGRCECYCAQLFQYGRLFVIVLGLRFSSEKKLTPEYDWWKDFCAKLTPIVQKKASHLEFQEENAELVEIETARAGHLNAGSAEFKDGKFSRRLDKTEGSYFRYFK